MGEMDEFVFFQIGGNQSKLDRYLNIFVDSEQKIEKKIAKKT
jgi:hypothetical protein